MNIPKKVKIGWKVYKVVKGDPENPKEPSLVIGGDMCYGTITYDRHIISLNKNFSKKQQKATLLHEMVHGISEMYGFGMEEDFVESFSNALFTVMEDNPGLFQ